MKCRHHWLLAEHVPHAEYDDGVCKHCGERRAFKFQTFTIDNWGDFPPLGRESPRFKRGAGAVV
jgi:hypothetical protein